MKPIEVLLIEDNPVDVRITREVFKECRIISNFHTETDGQSGTDFRRGEYKDALRPDLIALSLNPPKKHGSSIDVESETEQGAAFMLCFPLRLQAPQITINLQHRSCV